MSRERNAEETAEMRRLKRARTLWGITAFISGFITAICSTWSDEIPLAPIILVGSTLITFVSLPLFSWYEIKVVRFRQLLALPD